MDSESKQAKKSLKQLIKIELGYINHQVKKILNLSKTKSINKLGSNFNQSQILFLLRKA